MSKFKSNKLQQKQKELSKYETCVTVYPEKEKEVAKKASNKPEKEPIMIGCNYHTTWQSNKGMRFVLSGIEGNKAILTTRTTKRKFKTDVKDLIFIKSEHNVKKFNKLLAELEA